MKKMTAARARIWPAKGHYMGLNLGLFLQTGQINYLVSGQIETDDFAGVSGTAPDVRSCITWAVSLFGKERGSLSHDLSKQFGKMG
jgi:hypothetical protein